MQSPILFIKTKPQKKLKSTNLVTGLMTVKKNDMQVIDTSNLADLM